MTEELVFESITLFFERLKSLGGVTSELHGATNILYLYMNSYTDPNACSCKKTPKTYDKIVQICKSLSGSLKKEQADNLHTLLDTKMIVIKHNQELIRI